MDKSTDMSVRASEKINVERLNKKVKTFDKSMNETRRNYIQKSADSKRSASKLVLTS